MKKKSIPLNAKTGRITTKKFAKANPGKVVNVKTGLSPTQRAMVRGAINLLESLLK